LEKGPLSQTAIHACIQNQTDKGLIWALCKKFDRHNSHIYERVRWTERAREARRKLKNSINLKMMKKLDK